MSNISVEGREKGKRKQLLQNRQKSQIAFEKKRWKEVASRWVITTTSSTTGLWVILRVWQDRRDTQSSTIAACLRSTVWIFFQSIFESMIASSAATSFRWSWTHVKSCLLPSTVTVAQFSTNFPPSSWREKTAYKGEDDQQRSYRSIQLSSSSVADI